MTTVQHRVELPEDEIMRLFSLERERYRPLVPPRSIMVESFCTGSFDCECLSCTAWKLSCSAGRAS